MTAHSDFTGEDQALGLFATLRQSACDESQIEAGRFHGVAESCSIALRPPSTSRVVPLMNPA